MVSAITSLTSHNFIEQKDDLLSYAINLTKSIVESATTEKREARKQYFTPKPIAKFMSNLLFLPSTFEYKILEPGAGTGILSAAVCDRLLERVTNKYSKVVLDLYENDESLVKSLEQLMHECTSAFARRQIEFSYNIFVEPFNAIIKEKGLYNCVIANPPYSRMGAKQCKASGLQTNVPNTYAMFIHQAGNMLKENGELVFISPRSFCSGPLFQNFRNWFVTNFQISDAHVFESRIRVFDEFAVEQEIVIMKAIRHDTKEHKGNVVITTSISKSFDNLCKATIPYSDVVLNREKKPIIRLPVNQDEIKVMKDLDKWKNTLSDLNCKALNGSIVPFRQKESLQTVLTSDSIPLLWMQNLSFVGISWPKTKKPQAIRITEKTKSLLLPVKNYVLVKRISSKEQTRRLHATALLKKNFSFNSLAIENHVNYIDKNNGELSDDECVGLAGLLNTSMMDKYFRTLNGHNQVNVSDIRILPMPALEKIRSFGGEIINRAPPIEMLDSLLLNILTD
jgi:adenine-specific DNA-methyltransferase